MINASFAVPKLPFLIKTTCKKLLVLNVEEKFCKRVTTLLVVKVIVETRVHDFPTVGVVVLYKNKLQLVPIFPL